ncbi:MAG: hypothetical protein ABIC04_03975 [Nanoarchaeota archaeon]
MNKPRKHKSDVIFLLIALIALIVIGLYIGPAYTGYVTSVKTFTYTDSLGIETNKSIDRLWIVNNATEMNSVSLSGSVSLEGTAKVYIESDSISYLIFDSELVKETQGLSAITTIIPFESSNVNLEYCPGSVYDSDNDGVENTNAIIDFTVNQSGFSLNRNNLCTRWSVLSLDNGTKTTVCYGDRLCCNFIGLVPSAASWDNVFYLNYGAYSSTYNNIVSAQIISVDYNLSLDNPYTNISYSDSENLSASFIPASVSFNDICIETCSVNFNGSMYNLIIEADGASINLDTISYTSLKEIPNTAPVFDHIPSFKIDKELKINLSDYASDLDNDTLDFIASPADNLSIRISGSIASIMPDTSFIGKRYIYFVANDTIDIAVSNTIEINVGRDVVVNKSESIKQGVAVIGKPVRWVKSIKLNDSVYNISVNISDDAINFSVKNVRYGLSESINSSSIKVIDNGKEKNVTEYINDKKVEILEKKIQKLEDAKKYKTKKELTEINQRLTDYKNEKNKITGYAVSQQYEGILTRLYDWIFNVGITGNVVFEQNQSSANNTQLIIGEVVEELEIEYYTEGPIATEINISPDKKQIIVSSDIHYENILTYTYLQPEAERNALKLFWLVNDTKKQVNFSAFDTDSDGLIDYIQWITPSLSNQTYELEITVLNVQSYPTVGGNWTVEFETSGSANLTISAYSQTTFAEIYDNSSTEDDLEFLEVKCNSTILNASVVLEDGTVVPYEVYLKIKRIKEIDEVLR